mmetsp:Transcript_28872/g.47288  ORF Transcript_28872/g.47288 Transcript_28872/m.47288 type:complete len:199 (+) Transcript_28872:28-624(+)
MSPLLFLLYVLHLWSNTVNGITCLLRPGDEECFFDESNVGEEVHGTFAVTHGEAPINVKIFDSTDKIVLELPETMENAYTFKAMQSGAYTICFKSSGSELQTIEFNLHMGDDVTVKNVMKEDHLTLIDESVQSLRRGVSELSEQTKYHRNRLLRHKKTTESTGSRITWWSLLQGTILVSLALIQTWIIKNLFDKKRTV